MNYVLILYPINPYISPLINPLFSSKEKSLTFYKGLIKRRYADSKIIIVLFSKKMGGKEPDFSQISKSFSDEKDWSFFSCGVDFQTHCKKKVYPKPRKIIDFCQKPIDKLIVGGFHVWDCVDRVAGFAHSHGIDVTVDEDLTEFFFFEERPDKIPESQQKSAQRRRKRMQRSSSCLLEIARKARKQRPWMFQI